MKRFVVAGLLVFVVVLVVTFPARIAYQWFAPPDIRLTGISGSVWNGGATEGLAAGAYVRNIRWRIKPMSLVSGKLAYTISSNPAAGTLLTDIAVSLDGTLTLSELSGNVPLDLAHPALQQNGIGGDVQFQFDSLVVRNGLPVAAAGSVTIANLYSTVLSAQPLGDYRADFQTIDTVISGTVADVSGVLDLDAVISLGPDRSYSLLGDVAARPDAPPSIEDQLRFLGSPDARGYRQFRFEGKL